VYAFFTLWRRRSGGVTQPQFVGNVFIRPSNIVHDRVIGPSGHEKPGERTLAYFIAHEVTHAMTGDRVGRWRYAHLAAFQLEGYADRVAFDHHLDLPAGRAALLRDDAEMGPSRSGLYKRYELMVAYLLQRRGMTVDELLSRPMDRRQVEAQLVEDRAL
jgi:hypothetical protein